jgi:TRAP-type transport system periplasmic protein
MRKISLWLTALAVAVTPLTAAAQEVPLAERYLRGEVKLSTPFKYTGAPIKLRYSTFLGSVGTTPSLYRRLWERLHQDTGGKITIEPFWSNSLSDAQTGAFESISAGLADMGTCYTQLNPGGFDLHFGIQLPTLFTSSSVGTLVFNDVYVKYLRETYERRRVYLTRVGLTPPQQLLSKAPIRSFDDMRGKRAWSVGKVANMAVASLGLEPVSLRISELYPGFQSGVLDVAPMHDAGALLFRLNEIARYRTPVNLWTNPNEHCVNIRVWQSLPKEVRDYLYHWFQVWTQVESQLYYDAEAARAREAMLAQGIEFIELPDSDKARVLKAYESVIDTWIKEQENAGRPGRSMVETMRELKQKYEKLSEDERMRLVLDRPVPGMMPGY